MSADDRTNDDGGCAFDVEEFRKHLLDYRTKPDDSDLDLSFPIDLDSSFKRILHEKRQMTNRENIPPPPSAAIVHASVNTAATINPPEKPLRKDLLKERLLSRIHDDSMNATNYHSMDASSYLFQNTISNDVDLTINRLMADFNLNRESLAERRSPLKAIRLIETLTEDSRLIRMTRTEQHSNVNVFDSGAERQTVEMVSNTTQTATTANADDTLEEIEYVLDRGLNYVPKRLRAQMENNEPTEDKSDDENDENNENYRPNMKMERDQSKEAVENDDSVDENNENIENCADASQLNDDANENDDDDVILIESSPENSFKTTQHTEHFKSAVESIDNTFYTAKTHLQTKCSISIDDDSIENIDDSIVENADAGLESKSDESIRKEKLSERLEQSQQSMDDSLDSRGDKTIGDFDDMPENFNDSLERAEFMIKQGQKYVEKQKQAAANNVRPQAPINKFNSPSVNAKQNVLTPNGGAVKKILPTSSTKKTPKHLTPIKNDMFKRPEPRALNSPLSATKTPKPFESRIPKPKHAATPISSSLKPQFRHIASPIAAYINHTPEVPLIKTIKPMKNTFTTDHNKEVMALIDHNDSTQSIESFPTKAPLPCKSYVLGAQRKIIDNRKIVTPGGKSVQKLIGNPTLVIRHDGKIKSNFPLPTVRPLEDSLADLSVASGDISVQVVKDVHRKH